MTSVAPLAFAAFLAPLQASSPHRTLRCPWIGMWAESSGVHRFGSVAGHNFECVVTRTQIDDQYAGYLGLLGGSRDVAASESLVGPSVSALPTGSLARAEASETGICSEGFARPLPLRHLSEPATEQCVNTRVGPSHSPSSMKSVRPLPAAAVTVRLPWPAPAAASGAVEAAGTAATP